MAWRSIVTTQIVPLDNRHSQLFNPLSIWNPQRIIPYFNEQTIPMKGEPPGWSYVFLRRSNLRDKRFLHAKQRPLAWV
jgi:hypothetical protein